MTPTLLPELTENERIEIRLAALNDCAPEAAQLQFKRCCSSSQWAERMAELRPFSSLSRLLEAADDSWWTCSLDDWLQAFAGHPRIGDRGVDRWSSHEQSRAASASLPVLEALKKANQAYENKFGHVFIVCATGKSAEEVLALLCGRLTNSADVEIRIAAEEQRQITRIRLRKLLGE